MLMTPNAKCQRVLVLALCLIRFVVDLLYYELYKKMHNRSKAVQQVRNKSTTTSRVDPTKPSSNTLNTFSFQTFRRQQSRVVANSIHTIADATTLYSFVGVGGMNYATGLNGTS